MFHAQLISLSRGQSYAQVDILEARHGDFNKFGVPAPFGDKTIAFFHNDEVIIAHPWGVRIIHLDKEQRGGGPNCFEFDRIIIDGDVSYQNGVYVDDSCLESFNIPDIFVDPGEVIDQVTFSTSQGVFITHDANIVSIIKKYNRGNGGVKRSTQLTVSSKQSNQHKKINRRA